MRKVVHIALVVCILVTILIVAPMSFRAGATAPRRGTAPSTPTVTTGRTAVEAYAKQPLRFELNQGQTDRQVSFLSRGHGSILFLTSTEAMLNLASPQPALHSGTTAHDPKRLQAIAHSSSKTPLHLRFLGSNPNSRAIGINKLPGVSNYFIGNDLHTWHTNVPSYAEVQLRGVYPGIDLLYYGNDGNLEYDWQVAPGADTRAIRLAISGTDQQFILDSHGSLVLHTTVGTVLLHAPNAYQVVGGTRQSIPARYVLQGQGKVGISLSPYDHGKALVIDPVLTYSTYLGGTGDDFGYGIAVDGTGNAYITGYTSSTDFPTANALQSTNGGSYDAFVTKINPAALQPPLVGGDVKPPETLGNGPLCIPCRIKALLQGLFGDPVNTATGNFTESSTDIAIPGRGISLNFNRTYNALGASTNGPLGYGWTFGVNASLSVNGTTGAVTIAQENGSQVAFNVSGSTYVPAAPRDIATLVHNGDGTWTMTRFASEKLVFSSAGQLISQSDLNGYTTKLTYTSGQLTTITDAAGRTLTLGYTGTHLTSVTDQATPTPRKVLFGYNDGAGNLTDVTDVLGFNTHYTYDPNHLLLTMRDRRGNTITNHYDASSRVDYQLDRLNRKTVFVYAPDGSWTTTTDPQGNVILEQYQHGVRTALTRGYGTPAQATWTFLYDPATLGLTTVTDPNGHVTTSTYDSSGNLLTVIDALGHKTTNTYDSLNDLLTSQDPMGVTTTMTYDVAGNLLTTSRPLVGTTQVQVITYQHTDASHPGDVTGIVDPNGKTSTLAYDPYGDVVTAVDPLGNKATATYNIIGWKLTSVSSKGNVAGCGCSALYTMTFAHDPDGRFTTVTDPLGHKAVSHYDQDRNLDSFTDANGKKTTYTYDADNELTVTTRADTTTVKTDYNADGTILDQIDGKGNATTYKYDPLARAISVTDPLNRATTFTYDAAGNLLTLTDPQSQVTTYAYDVGNELTSITYSDGKTAKVSGVTYDADGRRTAMTDGTGTSTWTWDSLGRLTTSKNGAGSTVSYSYDLKGQLITLTYPTGQKVTRGYDNGGHLTSVSDWLTHTTTFGYDVNSNMTSETLPAATGVVDTNTFDNANNLATISDKKGGTTIFAATYGRDSANQLTSDTSVPAAVGKYKYTTLNQLCYAGSANSTACASPPSSSYPYTFDSADNLTKTENATHTGSVTQQFNAADELCWTVAGASANACASAPTGSTTYAYDTLGNRTGALTGTAGKCDAFDQANRLTSIKKGTGATCATPTTVGTYAYNGDGLRTSKTIGANTTQNTWGMGLLLQEKVGSATATSYVYGPGGLPLEEITPTGKVYYYHHDQLASTRAITNSAGAAKATYTYDPYGNVTACTGATVTVAGSNICTGTITVKNPLTYSGQYRDDESGLMYLRARYYDPATAQFLSRDPAVGATRSPYAYVAGNPLNGNDPSGLDPRSYEHLSMIGGQKAGCDLASDTPVNNPSNGVQPAPSIGTGSPGIGASSTALLDVTAWPPGAPTQTSVITGQVVVWQPGYQGACQFTEAAGGVAFSFVLAPVGVVGLAVGGADTLGLAGLEIAQHGPCS